MATSFSGGGSQSTRRKPPTLGKQLVNFITCGCKSSAPFFFNLQSWAWTHAVVVIGLYELLDPMNLTHWATQAPTNMEDIKKNYFVFNFDVFELIVLWPFGWMSVDFPYLLRFWDNLLLQIRPNCQICMPKFELSYFLQIYSLWT